MLAYYRNILLHHFMHESYVVISCFTQESSSIDKVWGDFDFLQKLLQWEFLCRNSIVDKESFMKTISFLKGKKVINVSESNEISLNRENSDMLNYLTSLIYPFIDGYWVTLTFIQKFMLKGKQSSIPMDQLRTRIQWLAETLHDDGYIKFYESCSMDLIKASIYAYQQMGVLRKQKVTKKARNSKTTETHYAVNEEYQKVDKLAELVRALEVFRSKPSMKLNKIEQQKFVMEDEEMMLVTAKL